MGAMGRRAAPAGDDQGREPRGTRAALVEGAIETLREAGFAGASARQIARRANCNQALVFYHFGSVHDLLLAALEDISARRLSEYRGRLENAATLTDLIDGARSVFVEDLDSGQLTVLVEMINGAQSVPGLGERVAACLAPWRDFAETTIRRVLASSPVAALLPAREVAHGAVAGILGLELLADLDGDRTAALALFDRASVLAALIDLTGGLTTPSTQPGER
jgi:AcrR family transcriptional regulator